MQQPNPGDPHIQTSGGIPLEGRATGSVDDYKQPEIGYDQGNLHLYTNGGRRKPRRRRFQKKPKLVIDLSKRTNLRGALESVCRRQGLGLPVYHSGREGSGQRGIWTTSCRLTSGHQEYEAKGEGPKKKISENEAAAKMLEQLQNTLQGSGVTIIQEPPLSQPVIGEQKRDKLPGEPMKLSEPRGRLEVAGVAPEAAAGPSELPSSILFLVPPGALDEIRNQSFESTCCNMKFITFNRELRVEGICLSVKNKCIYVVSLKGSPIGTTVDIMTILLSVSIDSILLVHSNADSGWVPRSIHCNTDEFKLLLGTGEETLDHEVNPNLRFWLSHNGIFSPGIEVADAVSRDRFELTDPLAVATFMTALRAKYPFCAVPLTELHLETQTTNVVRNILECWEKD